MELVKKNRLITLLIFIGGLVLIIFGIVLNNKKPNVIIKKGEELLGEDRIIVQEEITGVIKKYLNNSKIKSYLSSKNKNVLTMKELKDDLKVDISEFEKLKYGCDSELTTVNYNFDYSDYNITLTCDVFFMKG